jgi:hypothetical protein
MVSCQLRTVDASSAPLWWLLMVVLFGTATLAGCAQIRRVTYPADFVWLDGRQVEGTMHSMANSMQRLQQLAEHDATEVPTGGTTPRQAAVLDELSRLESLAISLSGSTARQTPAGDPQPTTNHLLIDEHIDDFIEQILHARLLAESDPPNFYGIGQLTGNCNACHRLR